MSHAVAEQIIGALEVIDSREGDRAELLAKNSIYFREKLQKKGFNIIGNKNSPVVPLLTTSLSGTYKAVMFMWKKGIASVMVGYPATPLLKPRIRFCLSSSHSKSDLDFIIDTLEKARAKILFT
ncbi:MAG: Serine palmitoyltransferase 2 [Paramarteilia canceri]